MSCAIMKILMACEYPSRSKLPSGLTNFIRFIEARLQAELSRCMYSEHGFEALMRPEFGQVCHLFMVVSNCIPGSAQFQVASAIKRISSLALTLSATSPVFIIFKSHQSSFSTARMNSSEARTELLAFWKKTLL